MGPHVLLHQDASQSCFWCCCSSQGRKEGGEGS